MNSLRLSLAALCLALCLPMPVHAEGAQVWVEAESFKDPGGWVMDTQFIDIMGSAYLMAHGLGKPVADASTEVMVPTEGKYRVWVRTKNWVGPWGVSGAPGRFQMTVFNKPLEKDFGATGTDWQWEDGGVVDVAGMMSVPIHLHDMTGFDGRVDAIILSNDLDFKPSNDFAETTKLRHKLLGLPDKAPETSEYDLVVVGGGYSGLGAAISGARQGLKVALVQDRPVLGGNGSSEVQVWAMGGTRRGLYPHLGEIVEEFADRAPNSPGRPEEYGDKLKEDTVRAEKNIDLMLSHHVYRVEMNEGPTKTIRSVIALDVKAGAEKRIRGKFFCDATGHGTVGALAGAEFTMLEKGHMGMSNMWVAKKTTTPSTWPDTPWALPLTLADFPLPKPMEGVGKKNTANQKGFDLGYTPMESPEDSLHGEWFWEGGFDKHPLKDLELIRDWNFRAVFGAFTAMRKLASEKYGNYDMQWLAYIGGTRESRLLQGDVVLTPDDIVGKRQFPDGCVPTTWDLDLHYPKEQYLPAAQGAPFISRAQFGKGVDKKQGYPVPYRCFYSKSIDNLFMAGRCISVTHEALGTIRVMRTCGMMGEVVGKAAYLTVRHQTTPRGVYDQYLDDLKELMRQPGAMRRDNLEAALYLPKNAKQLPEITHDSIDPKTLEGVVIDDADAELTGKWTAGDNLKGYVGDGYRYSSDKGASARFAFAVKQSGRYEVRVLWQPHENRAKSAPVTVLSAAGEKAFTLDQTKPGELDKGFHSLGAFEFKAGEEAAVIFRTAGAKGNVHIDAVQVLPAK